MTAVLIDLAKLLGALMVIGGFLAALSRLRPVRWVGRTLIAEPLGKWFRAQVEEATAAMRHLITYHLGSNDTTKPFHERLCDLEIANGLPPTPQIPDEDES